MLPVRTALDEGQPREALRLLDDAMDVKTDADFPADMGGENSLYVLDRGSIKQSVAQFDASKRDLEAADKAVDMLDLAHDAEDSIGEYVFSGSSGKYQAPPHEKLLINTLDMLNYLEQRDLNGARVEARRLAVMQKYVADDLHEGDSSALGLGAFLAGFTFEKSDQVDEALRWYDQALEFTGFHVAPRTRSRTLLARGQYRTPRLKELESSGRTGARSARRDGRGRDRLRRRLRPGAAQGAPSACPSAWRSPCSRAPSRRTTWPPRIASRRRGSSRGSTSRRSDASRASTPSPRRCSTAATSSSKRPSTSPREVRAEWKKIEGKVIVSAITRMIARYAAGACVNAAAGDNRLLGLVLSLGTQATLTALDTPDTRSWETLPARVAIARVRVPAGQAHRAHRRARRSSATAHGRRREGRMGRRFAHGACDRLRLSRTVRMG